MPKVAFVSDTHMHPASTWKVPECDILIHTGDFSFRGRPEELMHFVAEMKKVPARHKILVPGNHDWGFQHNPRSFRDICEQNGITVLIHEYVEIEGLKIFGTPYQPYFCNWAFNVADSGHLSSLYSAIPTGLDILATHCPPNKILDHCDSGNVGSTELRERVDIAKPGISCFGHIHESYGTYTSGETTYINASVCDEMYRAVNPAILVQL